jgi:hypothetical protein
MRSSFVRFHVFFVAHFAQISLMMVKLIVTAIPGFDTPIKDFDTNIGGFDTRLLSPFVVRHAENH